MRYLFVLILIFIVATYLLMMNNPEHYLVAPSYRLNDMISQSISPSFNVFNTSMTKISKNRIESLKDDYKKIWAHLDNLHNTNDIISGKRFYTEKFFYELVSNKAANYEKNLKRTNLRHMVFIKNISPDGLVCTIIDRSVLLKYETPTYYFFDSVHIAMVLLYQGENWRIDAIQVFN